uniref:CSON012129 protein n=1 Tax=Culicoides sonorensis TaxID=179676 RepID=A0A336M5G8_CULSO
MSQFRILSIYFGIFGLLCIVNGSNSQGFHLDSEAIDKVIEIRDACLEGTGSNIDEIRSCHNGILPTDKKFKCFITCNLFEHELIDDDGKVRKQLMEIEAIRDIIGHCADLDYDEYCENGYQIAKCLVEKLNLYDELCSVVAS